MLDRRRRAELGSAADEAVIPASRPLQARFGRAARAASSRSRSPPMCGAGKDGKANALLKLIAGMLGVGLDVLKQREQARRQRLPRAGARRRQRRGHDGDLRARGDGVVRAASRLKSNGCVRKPKPKRRARRPNFMVDLFRVLGSERVARQLDHGARDSRQGRRAHRDSSSSDRARDPGDADGHDGHGVYEPRPVRRRPMSLLERSLADAHCPAWRRDTIETSPTSMNHLGEVLTLEADYAAAEQRLREALAIRRRALPTPDASIAKTLADLGDVLDAARQDMPEATPFVDEALAMRRELYGDADQRRCRREPRGSRVQPLLPRRLRASCRRS